MRLLILFIFLIVGINYSKAQCRTLKDFQWENRLLVIYSAEEKTSQLESQLKEITNTLKGYSDRDLQVILLKDQEVKIWNSEKTLKLNFDQIMKQLDINQSSPYQNLLIGKDGGVKLRSISPISDKKLFQTIDAMPMRQREMRIEN